MGYQQPLSERECMRLIHEMIRITLFGFIIPGHLVNQDFTRSKFKFTKVNSFSV